MKHFVIITGYNNTKQKEKMLEDLLARLSKNKNLTLCYCTHHSNISKKVYALCDYVIYNKENPILNWDITDKFTQTFGSYVTYKNTRIVLPSPYHGYAHFLSLCDGISLGANTYHKTFTFLNYDVIDDCVDAIPNHIELLKKHDAVVYPYDIRIHSTHRMNTEFFSFNIKTGMALYKYRDYAKFSDFSGLHLEQNVRKMLSDNGITTKTLTFEGETQNFGKVAFNVEPKEVNDKFYLPFYQKDINGKKETLFFTGLKMNSKYYFFFWGDMNASHYDISLNEKKIPKNESIIEIEDPCFLKVYVEGELVSNVKLHDDRQFRHIVHPEEILNLKSSL